MGGLLSARWGRSRSCGLSGQVLWHTPRMRSTGSDGMRRFSLDCSLDLLDEELVTQPSTCWTASAAACRRFAAPSLARILATWSEAVLVVMNSCSAISGFVSNENGTTLSKQSAVNREEVTTLVSRRVSS